MNETLDYVALPQASATYANTTSYTSCCTACSKPQPAAVEKGRSFHMWMQIKVRVAVSGGMRSPQSVASGLVCRLIAERSNADAHAHHHPRFTRDDSTAGVKAGRKLCFRPHLGQVNRAVYSVCMSTRERKRAPRPAFLACHPLALTLIHSRRRDTRPGHDRHSNQPRNEERLLRCSVLLPGMM